MIGILGGMGPESTSYTYMRMIRSCQERYGACLDSDFPPIILFSMPVPDVVEEGKAVLPLLDEGLSRLAKAGASFSLIACNTMQGFVPSLREKYDVLSLVEETVKEADPGKAYGILGTKVTLAGGLYQRSLAERGIGVVVPTEAEQAEVTRAIRLILAGGDLRSPKGLLLSVIGSMERRGAGGVILACTDLPIALTQADTCLEVLDTADASARAAVERWRGVKTMPDK